MNYSEQLQHPLWQKRRLEIIQEANWKCSECGTKDDMLTVHHSLYVKGWKPWEYPDELLSCLCAPCHLARQNVEDSIKLEMMKRLHGVPLKRLEKFFWAICKEAVEESCTL